MEMQKKSIEEMIGRYKKIWTFGSAMNVNGRFITPLCSLRLLA